MASFANEDTSLPFDLLNRAVLSVRFGLRDADRRSTMKSLLAVIDCVRAFSVRQRIGYCRRDEAVLRKK